jgi:hypothetical protein
LLEEGEGIITGPDGKPVSSEKEPPKEESVYDAKEALIAEALLQDALIAQMIEEEDR